MAANPSIQLGTDGNWAIKEDNLLAYKKDGNRFFNKEFDFSRGSLATFVGENGLIQESATNTPRIDFKNNATGHLLLEPQSTNLVTYSEDFSQSVWEYSGDLSIESGYTAPDGSNTAYKVTGTNSPLAANFSATSTQTRSIYAKTLSGTGTVQLLAHNSNTNNTFTITPQWQRFEINNTTSSVGEFFFYAVDFRGASTTLSEVILWGAQLEDLSYASSYIPTSGSTVTRSAEVCNNSGSEQDFNDSEGVLFAQIAALADDGTNRILGISNGGDFNNSVLLRFSSSSNRIQAQVRLGGVYQCSLNYDVSDATEFNKIAFKYKQDDFSLYVNGVERATDTSGNVITGLDVLDFDVSTTNEFYGNTKELEVFKRALTDLELESLTSWDSFIEMATELEYTIE